jgi:hypothetical protein
MMNIKPNIGILNALIRITIGLTLLSWCTAKLVKQPWRDSYLFVALCGAMKVAEGIVRFCPVTLLFEKCQVLTEEQNASPKGEGGAANMTVDEGVPYNPS